jgi:hypothetical protein
MSDLLPSKDPFDPNASVRRRLLLMVAGGMATILLLACCLCGGGLFYFRPKIEQNPEKAVALTSMMLRKVTIPPSFEPRGTIELNVFHQLQVNGAYYERPKVDSILALIHVDSSWNSKARVRQHIRETLLERGVAEEPLQKIEQVNVEIAVGQSQKLVNFEFSTCRDVATEKTYKLVEGLVDGISGDVLICYRIDAEHWPEEEPRVRTMLESIEPGP